MFRQKCFKVSLALLLTSHSFVSTAANYYAEEIAEQEITLPKDEEKDENGTTDSFLEEKTENVSGQEASDTLEQVESLDDSETDVNAAPIVKEKETIQAEKLPTREQEMLLEEQKEMMQQRELKASTTDLASGTYGTSPWRIDDQGVLYISGGELGEATMNVRAPWYSHRSSINKIVFTAPTVANAQSLGLFFDMNQVLSIENLTYLDTSKVEDMSYFFYWCSKLSAIDVSGFHTEKATNMNYMFYGCSQLQSLDLSSFDTSQVTQMLSMFYDCSSLTALDVSSFDTSQTTDMGYMFYNCSNLPSLDVSHFDTGNVRNMSHMFRSCSRLTQLDVTGFDTKQVTDMSFMFYGCSELTDLSLQNFDTSKVLYMHYMFYRCTNLTSLPVEQFDTSQVTSMRYMFYGCQNLATVDVSNFDMRNVTTTSYMFYGCTSLTQIDTSNFHTPKVKFMNYMFANCSMLTELDFSAIETGALEEMNQLFSGMTQLSVLTLGDAFQFLPDANLPTVPAVEPNTGYWQNIGNGTVQFPKGDYVLTSEELMATYDKTMADTYVWQKVVNLESIVAKDSTLYIGDSWDPADNFVSATDKEGHELVFDPTMVSGTVDTSVAGVTTITYTNGSASQTIQVTVKENQESIQVKNSILYVGELWDPADNFVSATDRGGQAIVFDPSMINKEVDSKTPGIYLVTYTNGSASQVAEITVKENKETISAKDLTIYVGDVWNPADQFISATDKTGSPLFFTTNMVSGEVDTTKIGTYKVLFQNGQAKQQATVTVKENKETIHAKDTTIYVGETWNPADNFLSATDKEGRNIGFDQQMVEGKVDTAKVGVYPITYKNGRKSATVFVRVIKQETTSNPDSNQENQNSQTQPGNTNNQQNTGTETDNETKQAKTNDEEGKILPKTGYRHSSAMGIGVGIVAFSLALFYKKRQKRK